MPIPFNSKDWGDIPGTTPPATGGVIPYNPAEWADAPTGGMASLWGNDLPQVSVQNEEKTTPAPSYGGMYDMFSRMRDTTETVPVVPAAPVVEVGQPATPEQIAVANATDKTASSQDFVSEGQRGQFLLDQSVANSLMGKVFHGTPPQSTVQPQGLKEGVLSGVGGVMASPEFLAAGPLLGGGGIVTQIAKNATFGAAHSLAVSGVDGKFTNPDEVWGALDEAGKQALIWSAFGGLGNVAENATTTAGKVAAKAGEFATLAGGSAAMEGRMPTAEEIGAAAGTMGAFLPQTLAPHGMPKEINPADHTFEQYVKMRGVNVDETGRPKIEPGDTPDNVIAKVVAFQQAKAERAAALDAKKGIDSATLPGAEVLPDGSVKIIDTASQEPPAPPVESVLHPEPVAPPVAVQEPSPVSLPIPAEANTTGTVLSPAVPAEIPPAIEPVDLVAPTPMESIPDVQKSPVSLETPAVPVANDPVQADTANAGRRPGADRPGEGVAPDGAEARKPVRHQFTSKKLAKEWMKSNGIERGTLTKQDHELYSLEVAATHAPAPFGWYHDADSNWHYTQDRLIGRGPYSREYVSSYAGKTTRNLLSEERAARAALSAPPATPTPAAPAAETRPAPPAPETPGAKARAKRAAKKSAKEAPTYTPEDTYIKAFQEAVYGVPGDRTKNGHGIAPPKNAAGTDMRKDVGDVPPFTWRKKGPALDKLALEHPEVFPPGVDIYERAREVLNKKVKPEVAAPYADATNAELAQHAVETARKATATPVNESEMDPGDLVFTKGEWHKVSDNPDGGKLLKDGSTTELGNFDSIDAKMVAKTGTPEHEAALKAYREQEAETHTPDLSHLSETARYLVKRYKTQEAAAEHVQAQIDAAKTNKQKVDPATLDLLKELQGKTGDLFGAGERSAAPEEYDGDTLFAKSEPKASRSKEQAPPSPPPQAPKEQEHTTPNQRPRIELPGLVRLADRLLGEMPNIAEIKRRGVLGFFRHRANEESITLDHRIFIGPEIDRVQTIPDMDKYKAILAERFNIPVEDVVVRREKKGFTAYQRDHEHAGRTLAHEIGHAADYLDDKNMKRGGVLGHIAALNKFTGDLIGRNPEHVTDTITPKEREQFRAEAAEPIPGGWDEVTKIINEFVPGNAITVEDVKAVWNAVESQRGTPLYDFISRLSREDKVRIAKAAMRGTLDPALASVSGGKTVQRTVTEQVARAERVPTSAEILTRFKDRMQEEIRKRGLYQESVMREELKALTHWWRPFDANGDKTYTAYRHKASELYADAVSVMLNDPASLHKIAPNFTKAFYAYRDARPEVRDSFDAIYNEIKGGDDFEATEQQLRAGFRRGDAVEAQSAQDRKNLDKKRWTSNEIMKRVAWKLWDNTAYIPTEAGRAAMSEIAYSGNDAIRYGRAAWDEVIVPAEKAGITGEDIGLYMELRRAATEREDLANPGGVRGERAQAQLDHLRGKMGDETYNVMVDSVKKFWKIRLEQVIPKLEASGRYTPEMMEKIKNNEEYATFDVVDFMEGVEGVGSGASGTIHSQKGTFKDIMNPFWATLHKDLVLMKAAVVNQGKEAAIRSIQEMEPGEIAAAEKHWTGHREDFKTPDNPDNGLVVVYRAGKPEGFHTRKEVADLFKSDPVKASIIWRMTDTILASPIKRILVTNNPLFGVKNLMKDFQTNLVNMPGHFMLPRLLWNYAAATPTSFKHTFLKKSDAAMDRALANRRLISGRTWSSANMDGSSNTAMDRMAYTMDRGTERAWWKKAGGWVLNDFNHFTEVVSKMAAQRMLEKGGFDDAYITKFVRKLAGSPDFMQHGDGQKLLNTIFMFSNAGAQGIRQTVAAAKERPVDYVIKNMLYNVMPKLLIAGLAKGWYEDYLGKEKSEYWKNAYSHVSEWDMTTGLPIPLWSDEKASGVLRIPSSHFGQILNAAVWLGTSSENPNVKGEMANQALSTFLPWSPSSLMPVMQVAIEHFVYVQGNNPVDSFTNQPVVDPSIHKAGGVRAFTEFEKAEWNKLFSTVYKFERPNDVRMKNATSQWLDKPGISLLKRFYTVTDQGDKDRERFERDSKAIGRAKLFVPVKAFISDELQHVDARSKADYYASYKRAKAMGAIDAAVKETDYKRYYNAALTRRFGKLPQ